MIHYLYIISLWLVMGNIKFYVTYTYVHMMIIDLKVHTYISKYPLSLQLL